MAFLNGEPYVPGDARGRDSPRPSGGCCDWLRHLTGGRGAGRYNSSNETMLEQRGSNFNDSNETMLEQLGGGRPRVGRARPEEGREAGAGPSFMPPSGPGTALFAYEGQVGTDEPRLGLRTDLSDVADIIKLIQKAPDGRMKTGETTVGFAGQEEDTVTSKQDYQGSTITITKKKTRSFQVEGAAFGGGRGECIKSDFMENDFEKDDLEKKDDLEENAMNEKHAEGSAYRGIED